MSNIKPNAKDTSPPKIILITYRLKENPLFQPAEEILLHSILEKLGLTYEKIEYESLEVNNFFSKLPIIYFNGKIIINRNIIVFLKDLLFQQQSSLPQTDFNNFVHLLISILKDQLSFANDYYYYIKVQEKLEKSKNKRMFSSIKRFFSKRPNYESVNNIVMNSFPLISKLDNVFMPLETRITELIKDSFDKISSLVSREFADKNQNLFVKLLIYSFLKEDRLLFTKIKRPAIENLKYEEGEMFKKIGDFLKKVEDIIIKNSSSKFSHQMSEGFYKMETANILSIAFNPKTNKKKGEDIQQVQARFNYYHQLFTVGFFVSFGLVLYYLTSRNSKLK